ncbi:TRAP transporter substrate-binding protein DctP [Virgibacillus sp. W0430]|uniref:TRAP transporter substrate-binding protein n=1 Tax=Virgibacillus sp. W0430 TaxID=3391580 RepID=UPI003F473317
MKRIFSLFLFVALFALLVACGGNEETSTNTKEESEANNESSEDTNEEADEAIEPVTLRLAENQPDNNPVTIAMMKFAELAEEKSNGSVKIEVYPNAQLGQETENIDQVQDGALEMARVNSVPVAEIVKELAVFTLPYIFTDQDHKYKVLDGEIGQEVTEKFKEHGLISFGYLEAGSRNFYTTDKPIKSVADMKGLKIRVQSSETSIKMVELLGAVPTPMDYGEVFSGLQTGVIDGAENDFVSYYTSGHYEAAKHYSLDGHLSPPALVIMNLELWEGLHESQQKAISEAVEEAIAFEREEMNKSQDEFRAEVEKAGSQIYEVDVQEFQDAVAPIYDEYQELSDLIERVRNTN